LIPLTFTDGQKVWAWDPRAWLALALPATFLLFHVIVNRDGAFSSLQDNAGAAIPLIAALVFLVITILMWLFFRFRPRTAGPPGPA
jgi:lipoprotein signal peptidase